MAFTQLDIDRLKRAIAQGVTSVQFADRSVTYRSLEEMERILAIMEQELNPDSPYQHSRRATFTKGLDE